MPNWLLKAIPQKLISMMPGSEAIHHVAKKRLARSLDLTEFMFRDKCDHANRHVSAWQQHGLPTESPFCLEIGTGWYPIVPLAMALSGASSVYSSDIQPYTQSVDHQRLMEMVLILHQQGRLPSYLPYLKEKPLAVFLDGMAQHQSSEEIFERLHVYFIISQPGSLPLLPEPPQLIHSNNTLEHVPITEIPALLDSIYALLAPGGICSHYIDLTDHYHYFDPNLSPFHFLIYPEKSWRWIENRFQSQNRLRSNQWQELLEEAGLRVFICEKEMGSPKDIHHLRLASPFDLMKQEDILVRYLHLGGKKEN